MKIFLKIHQHSLKNKNTSFSEILKYTSIDIFIKSSLNTKIVHSMNTVTNSLD